MRNYVTSSPEWRMYNWDALLAPLRCDAHMCAAYGIRKVANTHMSFVTVDGRSGHFVNIIFTDLAPTNNGAYVVTDSFDISCCAIACRISRDHILQFVLRDAARDAVSERRLVLMPRAFHRFDTADIGSIDNQLRRIQKYARRGFGVETDARAVIRLV